MDHKLIVVLMFMFHIILALQLEIEIVKEWNNQTFTGPQIYLVVRLNMILISVKFIVVAIWPFILLLIQVMIPMEIQLKIAKDFMHVVLRVLSIVQIWISCKLIFITGKRGSISVMIQLESIMQVAIQV